jgi:nicotinate-nucleotide adenylyltransferase
MTEREHDPVGLFGGTFDPVHFGHLRAASEVREKLALSDFRLMPSGNPPHRSGTFASATQRLAMLRLAVAGHVDISVDDREVRREGHSYMFDTLSEIRTEIGESPLMLIIGQDAANLLDQWHRWRELFELAHLVIMRRPETAGRYSVPLSREITSRQTDGHEALLGRPYGHVLPLNVTQLAISSTDIRRQVGAGLTPRFLLPDPVIEYIDTHQLYRLEPGGKD